MSDPDGRPITTEWLRSAGFKWHQHERQPDPCWLLWLGRAIGGGSEELGIEVAPPMKAREADGWFCWLRSDLAHRYHRFIHVRHVRTCGEVVQLVEALTGHAWNPANHFYGMVLTPEGADRERAARLRLDRQLVLHGRPHGPHESDPAEAGANANDLQSPRVRHEEAA